MSARLIVSVCMCVCIHPCVFPLKRVCERFYMFPCGDHACLPLCVCMWTGLHYGKESVRSTGGADLHNFISSGFVTLGRGHPKGKVPVLFFLFFSFLTQEIELTLLIYEHCSVCLLNAKATRVMFYLQHRWSTTRHRRRWNVSRFNFPANNSHELLPLHFAIKYKQTHTYRCWWVTTGWRRWLQTHKHIHNTHIHMQPLVGGAEFSHG